MNTKRILTPWQALTLSVTVGLIIWALIITGIVALASAARADGETAHGDRWDVTDVCVQIAPRANRPKLQVRYAVREWNRTQDHVRLHVSSSCAATPYRIVVTTFSSARMSRTYAGWVAAETVITYPTYRAYGTVGVHLSTRYQGKTRDWRRGVVVHEFGHALGLPHFTSGQTIMHDNAPANVGRHGHPGARDLAFLNGLYASRPPVARGNQPTDTTMVRDYLVVTR